MALPRASVSAMFNSDNCSDSAAAAGVQTKAGQPDVPGVRQQLRFPVLPGAFVSAENKPRKVVLARSPMLDPRSVDWALRAWAPRM